MLVSIWKNCNPYALLVGMKNGPAALENSLVVPQNIKYADTIWPSNFTSRHILDICIYMSIQSCTWMFIALLFAVAQNCKQAKCPLIDE